MMSLDRLINILVTIALIEMMVLIGLRVNLADIVSTSRNWTLIARAAVANYLLVPSLTVVLLLLFGVNAMVTAGFLVLAVCPSWRHRRRSCHHCCCGSCSRGRQTARRPKSIRLEL